MKTMTLRALCTLAILAGLAVAPDAQTFRWEPNSRGNDVGDRVGRGPHDADFASWGGERALEQAQRNIERRWQQFERLWDQRARNAERIAEQANRNAARRAQTIERQVRARVQRQINDEIRAYRHYSPRGARSLDPAARRGARYADMQVGTDADPC